MSLFSAAGQLKNFIIWIWQNIFFLYLLFISDHTQMLNKIAMKIKAYLLFLFYLQTANGERGEQSDECKNGRKYWALESIYAIALSIIVINVITQFFQDHNKHLRVPITCLSIKSILLNFLRSWEGERMLIKCPKGYNLMFGAKVYDFSYCIGPHLIHSIVL